MPQGPCFLNSSQRVIWVIALLLFSIEQGEGVCLLCGEKKRERSVLFKASSVGESGRNGTRGMREVEDTFLAPQSTKWESGATANAWLQPGKKLREHRGVHLTNFGLPLQVACELVILFQVFKKLSTFLKGGVSLLGV